VFASGGEDEMVYVVDPRSPSGRPAARLNAGAIVLSVAWGPSEHVMGSLPWLAVGGGTPPSSFSASSDNLGGFIRIYDPRTWKAVGDCSSFGATPLRDQLLDAGQFGDADPRQVAEKAAAALRHYSSSAATERRVCDGDQDKTREAHRTWVSHVAPARLADGTVALASSGGDAFLRLWKLPLGPGGVLPPVLLQNLPTPEMSTCNSFAIF
jgi:WD40 repeat protein